MLTLTDGNLGCWRSMPHVSVIMPVFNMERYVASAISSVLAQTYADFELLIVDDGATDGSVAICEQFTDPRITILHQRNRGLAAARNLGLRRSQGEYIGFLDADDLWAPSKLARHVAHFTSQPEVGVSYSRAAYMDGSGKPLGMYQTPKLRNVRVRDIFVDNPIRNGSNAVIRRRVFDEIGRHPQSGSGSDLWYFDESLQRSEDHECWIRIGCTTNWRFEGVPDVLVSYRTNFAGLSANTELQYESWQALLERVRGYAPDLVAAHRTLAEAYERRYLAQRAILLHRDGRRACALMVGALWCDPRLFTDQPLQTLLTLGAAYALRILTPALYQRLEAAAHKAVGAMQRGVLFRMR